MYNPRKRSLLWQNVKAVNLHQANHEDQLNLPQADLSDLQQANREVKKQATQDIEVF